MFDQVSVGSVGREGRRVGQARSPRVARAGRVSKIRRAELRIDALVLRDAADWAVQHGVDPDDPFATGPAGGVGKQIGSDGTPWLDEHVAAEYGALRSTAGYEATELIIDAVDLRHRFPRIWRAIKRLEIRVGYARRISKQCRDLSREAAAAVDAELFRKAALGLPWPRLSKILAAAVMNADPALHKAKLAAAKFDRKVWLSETEHGLRTLVIKADAGDQILLYALIERIAEILLLDGDTDPVDQRRAKAAGWLARPEDLTVLLYQHSGGPKTQPAPSTGAAAAPPPSSNNQEPEPESDDQEFEAGETASADASADPESTVHVPGPEPSPEPCDGTQESASSEGADNSAGAGPADRPASDNADQTRDASATADDTSHATPKSPEPVTPAPPADWPDYNWDAPEPAFDPGVSDQLPPPRSRWHLPGPEPCPPTWCYQPPPDDQHDPPGSRLGCDVPRLVDYLTTKGLKPAPPRVNFNVHLTDHTLLAGDGVVRVDDTGPMLLSELITLLGNHHCQINLRPVLDPANLAAVDAYEVPQALRDAVRARHPASVFPYSSRHGSRLDLDHTQAYDHDSRPPGQTRIGNLGPLTRGEHRAKTAGVWHVEQPHPGIYLWRSPHRHYFLVTNQGTQALGPMPTPRPTTPGPAVVHLDNHGRHQRRSSRSSIDSDHR